MDKRVRVWVRRCYYSLPARHADRRLPVRLLARTVAICGGRKLIARRVIGRSSQMTHIGIPP